MKFAILFLSLISGLLGVLITEQLLDLLGLHFGGSSVNPLYWNWIAAVTWGASSPFVAICFLGLRRLLKKPTSRFALLIAVLLHWGATVLVLLSVSFGLYDKSLDYTIPYFWSPIGAVLITNFTVKSVEEAVADKSKS